MVARQFVFEARHLTVQFPGTLRGEIAARQVPDKVRMLLVHPRSDLPGNEMARRLPYPLERRTVFHAVGDEILRPHLLRQFGDVEAPSDEGFADLAREQAAVLPTDQRVIVITPLRAVLHGQQQSFGCTEPFRQLAEVVRRFRGDTVGQLIGQQGEYFFPHCLFVHHPADHILAGEDGRAQQSVIVFFDGNLRIVQRGERE